MPARWNWLISRERSLRTWGTLLVFVVLWADLNWQLSYTWASNEQYAYGWFVPLFAAVFFWKRWEDRPSPCAPLKWPLWSRAAAILALLALLPLRIIHEANPDWPLITWPLALAIVGLLLLATFSMGGWPWVRHFALPIGLVLVAVRWPWRLEHPLTQGLIGVVARCTADVLEVLGVPAVQHGNFLLLNYGRLSIEPACSGIRSLQANVMAALVIGELYLLAWPRRMLLLGAGIILAFVFNVVRTMILALYLSANQTVPEGWDSTVGLMTLTLGLLVLWACGVLLRQKNAPCLGSRQVSPELALPRFFSWAVILWIPAVLLANEAWYRLHETKRTAAVNWSVRFPTEKTGFKSIRIPKGHQRILGFDSAEAASWIDPERIQWTVYYFRWRLGTPVSAMHARGHRPEICLPANGLRLQKDFGIRRFKVGQIELPFEAYVFEWQQQSIYVFFCVWEDGNEHLSLSGWRNPSTRLKTTWLGVRRLGQRTAEIILTGCTGMEEAQRLVQDRLPELIQVKGPASPE